MEIQFKLYGGKVEGKFLGPTEDKPGRHMYYVNGKRKKGVTGILGIKDKSTALVTWSQEETAKHLFSDFQKGVKIDEERIVKAIFASDNARDKAADLGKLIHAWVESYIRHRLKEAGHKQMPEMPEDPTVLQGVTSFLEWEAEHKVKYLWAEKVFYSLKYDYIGQGDFGAVVDGIVCLCDLKSGNGLYNTVRMQTAAYAMADTEESKFKYEGRWAIRVAKETEKEYNERMALKNRIKQLLGKDERKVEPYQVFEAKFLDEEKGFMKRDFQAFLNCLELQEWDNATDFYREKVADKKSTE